MKHVSLLFLFLFLLVNCTGYDNEPYEEVRTRFSEMANQTFTSEMHMLPEILSTRAKTSDSFHDSLFFDNLTINCGIVWDMEDGVIVYAFGGASGFKKTDTDLYQFFSVDSHISEIGKEKISVVVHGNFSHALLIGRTPSYTTRKKLTIYGYVDPRSYLGEFTVVEVQDGRWEIE